MLFLQIWRSLFQDCFAYDLANAKKGENVKFEYGDWMRANFGGEHRKVEGRHPSSDHGGGESNLSQNEMGINEVICGPCVTTNNKKTDLERMMEGMPLTMRIILVFMG